MNMKTLKLIVFAIMLGLTHVCMAQDGDDENITLPTREIDGKTFYEISSADDMAVFSQIVTMRGQKQANGILTADIDMSQTTKQLWSNNDYNGTFDGDYHTISNLHIEDDNTIGLFYNIKSDAHLTRIAIKDAVVTGTQFVSALCGMSEGGKISRCTVSGGTLTATESYCAPICANIERDSKTGKVAVIENCGTDNVTITTPSYGAGIVGYAKDGTNITNSFSYHNTYSGTTHGGICAVVADAIEYCYTDESDFFVEKQWGGYVSDSESSVDAAKFNGGYVTLHLNNGRIVGSIGWYQNLDDKNSFPIFNGTKDMIVTEHTCKQGIAYLNPTQFDSDGFCRECDKGMPIQENNGWYDISLPGQLYYTNDVPGIINKNIRLMNDIVINKNLLNSDGELLQKEETIRKWSCNMLRGDQSIFDGQNHSISGLYCKGDDSGLFYMLDRFCTIKNLCIKDSYFEGDNLGCIGAIAQEPWAIVIDNCVVSATLVGNGATGGIIGRVNMLNTGNLTIKECTVSGKINNKAGNFGAVIGLYCPDESDIVISKCVFVSNSNISNAFGSKLVGNEDDFLGTNTKFFTEDQAKSGEMTYLLNNKTTSPYRQHLGYDFGPVFSDNDEYNVYQINCYPNVPIYSNDNRKMHIANDYTASTLYPGAQESACYCREKMDLKYKTTEDPDHKGTYYSTFYDSKNAFKVSDGMVPYTGTVEEHADSRVLKMAAIEDNVIPAGEAVVIKGTTPEMILTKKATDAKASETNALTGCDVATAAPENSYIFSYGQYKLGFYRYAAGKSLGAHKAYMTLDNSLNSKPFVMSFDDMNLPTSIFSLPGEDREDSQHSATSIYSIGGMRMPAQQRGINIVNGRKILNY